VDESLSFSNANALEDTLLSIIAEQPEVRHLVLIGAAINDVDASALQVLESLVRELRDGGVGLYLAAVKGPVMDRLQAVGFVDKIGGDHIFLSTHDAFQALGCT
jgi:SulP family sulfate permease